VQRMIVAETPGIIDRSENLKDGPPLMSGESPFVELTFSEHIGLKGSLAL